MKWMKAKYIEIVLIIVCLLFFFIFGPSFGVVFFCAVSFVFIVLRGVNLKKHFILKRFLMICFLMVGVSFLIIESFVISEFASNDSEIRDIDYVVVLGAGLKGSQLSKTLKQRLDTSLTYIRDKKDIPIILSGGKGKGEDITESEAMRDYLIGHGISEDRMILESRSTNTEENLLFSKAIVSEKGIKEPKIIIITSDYHMFRAKLISKKVGFVTYGISSESPVYLKLNYMTREYFAIIKTWLFQVK